MTVEEFADCAIAAINAFSEAHGHRPAFLYLGPDAVLAWDAMKASGVMTDPSADNFYGVPVKAMAVDGVAAKDE